MSLLEINAQLVGAQYDFYHDDTTRFLHLSGGYGSGKTTVLAHKLLKLSILNAPYDGGLVVPTFADFKNDFLPVIEGILEDNGIDFEYHGTDHKFKFPWSKGFLRVFTADKKIRGMNVAFIGVNELCLISKERYLEAIGRVRIKQAKFPQVVSSSTPEGYASPYYNIFVENPWRGSKILYMNTMENAHNLDPNYIQSLKDSYPKQLIDAYLHGLWVSLSGNRFYYAYSPDANDKINEPDWDNQFYCAMDQNVDPFCASIWQRVGNKFLGIEEIKLSGGDGFRVENMTSALKARGYTGRNTIICPDPTAKNRSVNGAPVREILEREGYQVIMRNVAPRFRERNINMNKHFEKKLIEINPKTMTGLKKDLIAVEMDQVNFEKSKKNQELTHFSDGLDYFIDCYSPFNSHRTSNSVSKIR